jgi:hypothetical protein
MAPYFFATSTARISRTKAKKYAAAAQAEGAEMTEINVREGETPGINSGRYQRWMECPNRGSPFDREIELAVLARLAKIDAEGA